MRTIRAATELIQTIRENLLAGVLVLLILFFASIILYKKFGVLQWIYNWVINYIFVFTKRENIMLVNFSKKEAKFSHVRKQYQEQGCLFLTIHPKKHFKPDGSIEKESLQKILNIQKAKMNKAIKRSKNSNSLIYLGFPHVPLAFLDGYHFRDTDDPVLYEYQGMDSECLGRGFYELNKKYNTDMKVINNYDSQTNYGSEITLKIEQSFPISNEDIKSVSSTSQVVSLGAKDPMRWNINNYAQIDLYQKEFLSLLAKLGNKGVRKIHLFATTPVSLSFSLGRMIDHYHPEIIVYNYNNTTYDWAINLRTREIITLT